MKYTIITLLLATFALAAPEAAVAQPEADVALAPELFPREAGVLDVRAVKKKVKSGGGGGNSTEEEEGAASSLTASQLLQLGAVGLGVMGLWI